MFRKQIALSSGWAYPSSEQLGLRSSNAVLPIKSFSRMVNSRTRLLTNCWPWSFQKIGPDSVLSRIYCLGEKSFAAEGHELPRGIRRHGSPEIFGNEYELRCNLVYFQTRLCSSTGNTYCICPHLVASGWFFFRYSYLYTVMITISLGGRWTSFFWGGGEAFTPQIPQIEPCLIFSMDRYRGEKQTFIVGSARVSP